MQFTNKVDIFTVDQASDNDVINTISKYTGSNLAVAQSSEYNITASSISTVGTISPISWDIGGPYDFIPTPTQSVWASPSNQFTSGVSYNQNMTTTVYVQTGKTATSSFTECSIMYPKYPSLGEVRSWGGTWWNLQFVPPQIPSSVKVNTVINY